MEKKEALSSVSPSWVFRQHRWKEILLIATDVTIPWSGMANVIEDIDCLLNTTLSVLVFELTQVHPFQEGLSYSMWLL